jgi:hypothetical protein
VLTARDVTSQIIYWGSEYSDTSANE